MIRQYMCRKGDDRYIVVSTRDGSGKHNTLRDAVAFDNLGNLSTIDNREKRRKMAAHYLRVARKSDYTITKTVL